MKELLHNQRIRQVPFLVKGKLMKRAKNASTGTPEKNAAILKTLLSENALLSQLDCSNFQS